MGVVEYIHINGVSNEGAIFKICHVVEDVWFQSGNLLLLKI